VTEVEHRNRPHGDEWRWRLSPARSIPSISVIMAAPTAGESARPARPFGFSRVLFPDQGDALECELIDCSVTGPSLPDDASNKVSNNGAATIETVALD
jgi:hypothetical protein